MKTLLFSLISGIAFWMVLEGLYFSGVFSAIKGSHLLVYIFHLIPFALGAIFAMARRSGWFASAFYLLLAITAYALMDVLHEMYVSVRVYHESLNVVEFVRDVMFYKYATMYITSTLGALLTIFLLRRFNRKNRKGVGSG